MLEREEVIREETLEELDTINSWRKLEFNIDETYEYVPENISFRIVSDILYYLIAFPILKVLTKIIYDLKIEGKENVRNLNSGAVTVSNHVLVLDCAMIALACGDRKEHFTALADSFKIPFVRKLIKLLKAIPIPTDINNKKNFLKAIDKLLSNNELVHVYPEGSLVPYCKNIRRLKNGAFDFSKRSNVPIVPMVFEFREPKGIRKIFKRKLDVTLKVLEPVYPDGKQLEVYKEEVYNKMKENLNSK